MKLDPKSYYKFKEKAQDIFFMKKICKCGKEIKGRRRKWCSDKCQRKRKDTAEELESKADARECDLVDQAMQEDYE